MKSNVQIGIYMHKRQPFHSWQMASIAYYTNCSYDLIIVNEPGTVHENINKVFDRATAQYLVLLDDDCIFTHPNWLQTVVGVLQKNENVGVVSCLEVKNLRTLRLHRINPQLIVPPSMPKVAKVSWVPGYLMAFDLYRTPGLRADEKIPFAKGMSDLDLSLQVKSRGKICALSTEVLVYHPFKGSVTKEQRLEYKSQDEYMFNKWGQDFFDAISKPIGTIMNVGTSQEEDYEDICCRPDNPDKLDDTVDFPLGANF